MSGLNIQRLRDIFDVVFDSVNGTLKTGGAQTILLGTFRAIGAGTGYSIDDIIIFRQTPPDAAEYFNATTGLVIATPDPADLGSIGSASSVSVTSSVLPTGAATAANQITVGSQTTKINDGTNTATVLDLTNSNPLVTAIVDSSGNQISTFGGGTQYSDGAARGSATGTLMLGDDGTLVQSLLVDSTGRLIVNTQGTVAGGATDSGNPVKAGGVFNTTRPTYTNGQRGDLQISNRGELLTAYEDFTTTPNNINTADSASSTTTGADGQNIITGNPTNNSTALALLSGNSSFAFLITGTWVGTLQFERTLDGGTTWTSIGAFAAGTNFIRQTTTSNGAFHGNASSSNGLRVRATAWTSGVASVRILVGQGVGTITVGNPIRLFDQTSSAQATIKPASTAAVATDTALVVTIREAPTPQQASTTLAQLTAAGSTAAVSMAGYTRAFVTLLVASINTNVVVRIEGSNDGTNWTNLSTANTDTTITANGTYGFVFVGCPASIRVTFVSESGGTAATIDAIVRVSA